MNFLDECITTKMNHYLNKIYSVTIHLPGRINWKTSTEFDIEMDLIPTVSYLVCFGCFYYSKNILQFINYTLRYTRNYVFNFKFPRIRIPKIKIYYDDPKLPKELKEQILAKPKLKQTPKQLFSKTLVQEPKELEQDKLMEEYHHI